MTTWPLRSVRRTDSVDGLDVADVRVLGLRERRRHADRDGVGLAEAAEVRRRLELPARQDFLQGGVGDVLDVRPPGVQPVHDLGQDVEAEDLVPGPGQLDDERKADIAESDDAEERLPALRLGDEGLRGGHGHPW